jgi:type VI secretion system protein VasD
VRSDHQFESGRAGCGWQQSRRAIGVAVVCAGLAAAALSGCKSTPPPPPPPPMPTPVTGSIQGASELNPSVTQRPSPLLLRVYELKSPTAFNQADFMALYQADQATLGADLVAREEFMLAPGEIRPYRKTLAPETRFIGVVAAYRNLEQATWRTIVPVIRPGQAQAQKLVIRADSLAVSASLQP